MFTWGLVSSNFSLAIALLLFILINNQHYTFTSCYRDLNPGPLPYQGSALPLSYNSKEEKKESGRRDSNPRPSAWKANALSTELLPHVIKWAKMDSNHRRRKPADLQSAPFGHSGICPTFFNRPATNTPSLSLFCFEPLVGFEPTTPRFQITCSGPLS